MLRSGHIAATVKATNCLLNLEHFGKCAFNGDLQKPTEQRDPWIPKSMTPSGVLHLNDEFF